MRSYLRMARFRASATASPAALMLPDVCAAASAANTPQLATNALGGPNSTTSPIQHQHPIVRKDGVEMVRNSQSRLLPRAAFSQCHLNEPLGVRIQS